MAAGNAINVPINRATPAHPESFTQVALLLAAGDLAILPTDTVYGICADARNDEAVRAIYTAKGKGADARLQLLFPNDPEMIAQYAEFTASAHAILQALGPAGWTLVVRASSHWELSGRLASGSTLGVRVPPSKVVDLVARALGAPLAASSANKHGRPSPTTCAEAIAQVGEFCAIAIDDGPTPQGIDSTVIDCSTDDVRILREGAIDRQTVARILGLSEIPVLRSVRQ